MQHLIAVDFSTFPEGFHSRRLVGPKTESGIESCTVLCSRVPPGLGGPELHTHPVDQFYYTLSGAMNLQLGTEVFEIEPNTAVFIPAGTPHRNWNSGKVDETHVEFFSPPPPRDRNQSVLPAEPRKIDNVGGLVRPLVPEQMTESPVAKGFRRQQMARRSMGSNHARMYVAELAPGGNGPSLHFHDYDQFYFVLQGTLTVQIGTARHRAGPNTLVVLPAGTIHTNYNESTDVERHIAFLVPEPMEGVKADHRVEIVPRATTGVSA